MPICQRAASVLVGSEKVAGEADHKECYAKPMFHDTR
jgi:hypothetical protein